MEFGDQRESLAGVSPRLMSETKAEASPDRINGQLSMTKGES